MLDGRVRTLLILDNINSSTRLIEGENIRPIIEGLDKFFRKVKKLESSTTFVIFASRSDESWNQTKPEKQIYGQNKYTLGGLDALSATQFAASVFNINIQKNSGYLDLLVSLLQGNPLAMKSILPLVSENLAGFFLACVTGSGQEEHLRSPLPFELLSNVADNAFLEDVMVFTFINGTCHRRLFELFFVKGGTAYVESFITRMTALGLLLPREEYFEIHPLLPIHLRGTVSEAARNQIGDKFIAYLVKQIQASTLESLGSIQEIADSVALNLFTAWTLAVENKDDLSRGTLFNALATIHHSVIRRPLYLEDFTECLVEKEGWLVSPELPLKEAIRCLYMIGQLSSMKLVRGDLESSILWAQRFLEIGERPTTIPGMPFLKFSGPLSPTFLPKLKEVEFVFKIAQPFLYSLYALATQIALKLGDYPKMAFFDAQKTAVDLPLQYFPVLAMDAQIMTGLISQIRTLEIMSGKPPSQNVFSRTTESPVQDMITPKSDSFKLPTAFYGTVHSRALMPELMSGFSALSQYFELPVSQLESRQNRLEDAKAKFQTALDISQRTGKTAPMFYIYRSLATIAYVQKDWEQLELYLTRFERAKCRRADFETVGVFWIECLAFK